MTIQDHGSAIPEVLREKKEDRTKFMQLRLAMVEHGMKDEWHNLLYAVVEEARASVLSEAIEALQAIDTPQDEPPERRYGWILAMQKCLKTVASLTQEQK